MTDPSNNLKAALHKMPRIVVLQWAGNLVLMLCAVLWLQVPDSHVWEFAFSIVFAALILLSALWLYGRTVRSLRGSSASLVSRLIVLLVIAALWFLLLQPIAWGRGKEQLFAGFLNSKLPSHLRYFFTYNRLLVWQECFYDLLQWIIAGLLLPPALEAIASGISGKIFRQAARVWRSGVYWLVVIALGFAGGALTRGLMGWAPGKGVAVETFSLFARLGIVYTLDILLWCFVLAYIATRLGRAEINRRAE